jgi:hypothetical protein
MSATPKKGTSKTKVVLGLAIAGLLAVVSGGLLLVTSGAAVSTTSSADQTCVPSAAWTETIQHPAVSHTETVVVVDQEAWTETIPAVEPGPDLWWNWSPSNTQGPQDYVPDFPVDNPSGEPRGEWQGPHENGGPMPDTYGTFQTGEGNSPYFHREHGTPGSEEQVIEHPAVTHEEQVEVVDQAAWTETVEHPAVVCEVTPPVVTPPVVTPPVVEPPVVEPPEVAPEEAEEPTTHQQAPEQEAPEVLGEQASAPAQQSQAPTVVDAGYAGQPSGDGWATALLAGGLLLLTSAGAVAAARRT